MQKVEYQQRTITRKDPHGARLLKKKMHSLKAQEKRLNNWEIQEEPDIEESINLLGSHIRIVPKLYVEAPVKAYIVISFNNFIQNFNNPEFRDNDISFFIMCHYDQWQLEDFQLRPYRIAAELDSMFDKKRFTGIGRLEFQGAQGISISDELAGLHLSYRAIHGGEDKVHALSPEEEKILFGDN